VKTLGVLESKWDSIRKKLVRRILEEQDKVLRSYFAQKGGSGCKGGHRGEYKGRERMGHVCVKPASQDRDQAVKSSLRGIMDMEGGGAS
jgi:hypothetical protein